MRQQPDQMTICPKPHGYEIKIGGGPYVEDEPTIATFVAREDADEYVELRLGLRRPDGADLWHVGEMRGDDGRVIRDENGLRVGEALTRADAKKIVETKNGERTT